MPSHDLTLSLLVGNGVPAVDSTEGVRKARVDIAPAYEFQRIDGKTNWPVVVSYTTDTGELLIENLEDTDGDGDPVVWQMRVSFLDRGNGVRGGGQATTFTIPTSKPNAIDYPADVDFVDVVAPPEYGPTWAAQAAASAASAAASAAAAAAVGAVSDAQTATNLTSGSLTTAALATKAMALGTANIAPTAAPYLERANSGSKATLHITNQSGFSGPYLVGIGNDNGATPGMVVANKAAGKGLTVHQQGTITDVNAWGLYVHQQSTVAPGLVVEQNVTGAAHGLVLRVAVGSTPGTGQKLAKFETAGNHLAGDISAETGTFRWIDKIDLRETQFNTTATFTNGTGAGSPAMLVITDPAGNPGIIEASNNAANKSDASLRFYRATGAGTHYAWQLTTDANIFRIQGASAAAKGSQSWNTLFAATGASIGFYGSNPVAKPSALPADASDLATTIALLNYIKNSVLKPLGLAA